ncbi:hypothetical protein VN97_g9679 [Penicillium thymicola]|uniref:Uncharacterized protein n=1 Tax=Penicillium thymicola TaxID=293382 RepID=A0AAI9TAH9_PENTH|nr:hypothetical protein VN97_g9679 [Penicillium thymicola]
MTTGPTDPCPFHMNHLSVSGQSLLGTQKSAGYEWGLVPVPLKLQDDCMVDTPMGSIVTLDVVKYTPYREIKVLVRYAKWTDLVC